MVVFIGYFYNDVLQRYQCYSAALGPPAANPSLLHTCAAFMKTEVVPSYLYHLIPSIRSHKLKMLWKQKFILDKKKSTHKIPPRQRNPFLLSKSFRRIKT